MQSKSCSRHHRHSHTKLATADPPGPARRQPRRAGTAPSPAPADRRRGSSRTPCALGFPARDAQWVAQCGQTRCSLAVPLRRSASSAGQRDPVRNWARVRRWSPRRRERYPALAYVLWRQVAAADIFQVILQTLWSRPARRPPAQRGGGRDKQARCSSCMTRHLNRNLLPDSLSQIGLQGTSP